MLIRQAQRFVISGLMATGVHVAVAICVLRFVLPIPTIANGVAYVVATAFSYIANTMWTFSNPLHTHTLLRYILVSLFGGVLAVAVSGAAEHFGLHYGYGIALVVLIVPPVSFILHRSWTYRDTLPRI